MSNKELLKKAAQEITSLRKKLASFEEKEQKRAALKKAMEDGDTPGEAVKKVVEEELKKADVPEETVTELAEAAGDAVEEAVKTEGGETTVEEIDEEDKVELTMLSEDEDLTDDVKNACLSIVKSASMKDAGKALVTVMRVLKKQARSTSSGYISGLEKKSNSRIAQINREARAFLDETK